MFQFPNNKPALKSLRRLAFACPVLATAVVVHSQESSQEGTYELSPFTVKADSGYAATNSLAGTRIATDLNDLPNSIAIITRDLMDDLDLTGAEDALLYVGNAEVAGPLGNYSAAEVGVTTTHVSAIRDPSRANRIRGLARADNTRNYFPTEIRFDRYNTQRVEINRGPNAVLFGLGSPGGIINTQPLRPLMRNRSELSLSFGSFGTHRASFDLERAFSDRFAFRIAGLYEDSRYRQEPTFERDRRTYGSLTYKPKAGGSFNASYEIGSIDANRPRPNAPRDTFTRWWDPAFNQVTHSPAETEFGEIDRDIVRAPGSWFFETGIVRDQPDATEANRIMFAWNDLHGIDREGNRVPQNSELPPAFRANMVSITAGEQWYGSDTATATGITHGAFFGREEILDRSIFDWVGKLLDGPNKREWEDFRVANLSYDRSWQHPLGAAGFELSYQNESSTRSFSDLLAARRGYSISIDINTTLPWGAANPNFGRPFVASWHSRQTTDTQLETSRATAFVELDFKRRLNDSLAWLGRHSTTAFLNQYTRDEQWYSGRNSNSLNYIQAVRSDTKNPSYSIGGEGELRTVVYLGPSVAQSPSPAGVGLNAISADLATPQTVDGYHWNTKARSFVTTPSTPRYAIHDPTFYATLTDASLQRQRTNSWAVVHQVYLFQKEWLVGTYSFRRDNVDDRFRGAERDPLTQFVDLDSAAFRISDSDAHSYDFSADTNMAGAVVHASEFLPLPELFDLSLHYSESENFQITPAQIDVFGAPLQPPKGTSDDRGISIGFGERFHARLNWYRAESANVAQEYPFFLLETDRRIIRYNTEEDRRDAGYQGPPQRYKDLVGWKIIEAPTPSGQDVMEMRPANLSDTKSTLSEGFELDAIFTPTDQIRFAFNAARQKARQAEIAPATQAYLSQRISEWTLGPTSELIADESDQPVRIRVFDTLINDLNALFAREGQLVPELREWRFNLIGNYRFSNDSPLKGISIGGATRWQDQQAIGYPIILRTLSDGSTIEVPDLSNPHTQESDAKFDFWVAYERSLKKRRARWKSQLTLRNVFGDGDILTVATQPDGSARSYRWSEGLTLALRNSLEF